MTIFRRVGFFFALLAAACLCPAVAMAFEPPAFHGDVLDEAAVLSPGEKTLIAANIQEIREKAGVWAAVYVARGLDGTTLEDAANRTFRAWGLGQAGKNNGVLVLIVPSTREVRIEVGYGLEGVLTDAFCSQVIDQIFRPDFRAGKFGSGISRGLKAMAEQKLGGRVALAGTARPVESLLQRMKRFLPIFLLDLIPGLMLAGIVAYGRSRGRGGRGEEFASPILLFAVLGAFLALLISSPGGEKELYDMLRAANGVIIGAFWIHLLVQSRRYLFASSYRRFLAEQRLYRIRRRSDHARMIFGQWFEPARVSYSRGGSISGSGSGSGSSSGSRSSSGGGSSGGGGASGRW